MNQVLLFVCYGFDNKSCKFGLQGDHLPIYDLFYKLILIKADRRMNTLVEEEHNFLGPYSNRVFLPGIEVMYGFP